MDPRDPPFVAESRERLRPRAPSVRLFRDARATPKVLDFLRDTRVGKMPGLVLFGFQGDESELEEIELVAPDEGSGVTTRRMGQAHPRMYFLLSLSFVISLLLQGSLGRRRGYLTMTARARPRQEKGYIEKPAVARKGSGKAMWRDINTRFKTKQNKTKPEKLIINY